jgi:hypothetical protein
VCFKVLNRRFRSKNMHNIRTISRFNLSHENIYVKEFEVRV